MQQSVFTSKVQSFAMFVILLDNSAIMACQVVTCIWLLRLNCVVKIAKTDVTGSNDSLINVF